MIKDSGDRTVFKSGGVRDIRLGKGKCDLLPLLEVAELLEYSECNSADFFSPVRHIYEYVASAKEHPHGYGDATHIYRAICCFACEAKIDVPTVIIEVSKHFEDGAAKYARNNWRLGLDASCYLDSGIRHYLKWKRGDSDEPHDRAFVWNMLCMVWTTRNRPECNDIAKIEDTVDE